MEDGLGALDEVFTRILKEIVLILVLVEDGLGVSAAKAAGRTDCVS